MAIRFFFLQLLILVALAANANSSKLSPTFYEKVCPQALPAIKKVVDAAVKKERRMGASLLRLHFHDCFVNGCDGSVLLDDTSSFTGEKTALPNINSARGFDVIDDIKAEVDRVCGGSTVSCADILAVVARDSVVALGGPTWNVRLGRRDSKTASKDAAESDIPAPNMDLSQLISNFKSHGLGSKDLVVLSGGHTLGFARCVIFRGRIHNETNIDSNFARSRRASCPSSGGDNNLAPLDTTPAWFDVHYFKNLVKEKGLLHSDQELYNGGSTDRLVKSYSGDPKAFSQDFARSMVKLGNIKPLTGKNGEVREKCRRVN